MLSLRVLSCDFRCNTGKTTGCLIQIAERFLLAEKLLRRSDHNEFGSVVHYIIKEHSANKVVNIHDCSSNLTEYWKHKAGVAIVYQNKPRESFFEEMLFKLLIFIGTIQATVEASKNLTTSHLAYIAFQLG